ncbi:TetR/AcrR family transcriptional regulator [Mycolicibacterium palauense]|uniref:TetR/AcrR family transcriptional regulator n=1 Tax=Mycolicibacterium palauense TaxID=2034511 RepID=UPI000BFF0A3B|nr:TetR/AcrR family transcriptional regulator [Mycolicibacterium palauense]
MNRDGRGRPRLVQPRRPGATAREEILDAAGELFTTQGYANTSTRAVADAVGIRQASLYHHFATKDDILDALLAQTLDAPLRLAAELLAEAGSPAQRLHILIVFDAEQLCRGRWNLGVLYLLPELRVPRFAEFRQRRELLRGHYRSLAAAVTAECDGPPHADDLPFRLVESVVNRRADDGFCLPEACWSVGDAALRLLGYQGDFQALRRGTADRLQLAPVNVTS